MSDSTTWPAADSAKRYETQQQGMLEPLSAVYARTLRSESFLQNVGTALGIEVWSGRINLISFDAYGMIMREAISASGLYRFVGSDGAVTPVLLNATQRKTVDPIIEALGYALARVRGLVSAQRNARDAQVVLAPFEFRVRPRIAEEPYNVDDDLAAVALQLGSLIPIGEQPSQASTSQ